MEPYDSGKVYNSSAGELSNAFDFQFQKTLVSLMFVVWASVFFIVDVVRSNSLIKYEVQKVPPYQKFEQFTHEKNRTSYHDLVFSLQKESGKAVGKLPLPSLDVINDVEEPPYETSTKMLRLQVDLNSATQAELTNLPRIGEKLARLIIEYREESGGFTDVDELLNVHGIGEKMLENLRPFCIVENPKKEEGTNDSQ